MNYINKQINNIVLLSQMLKLKSLCRKIYNIFLLRSKDISDLNVASGKVNTKKLCITIFVFGDFVFRSWLNNFYLLATLFITIGECHSQ